MLVNMISVIKVIYISKKGDMSNQSLYSSIWCDSTQILQTCSNSAAFHVIN
jgi:hypothetical protein